MQFIIVSLFTMVFVTLAIVAFRLLRYPHLGVAPSSASREHFGRRATDTALSNVNILLVDDNPSDLSVLTALLVHSGASVTAANSVDEALPLIASGEYHVVLSDLRMPGKSGYDLVEHAKDSNIPIVAVTGVPVDAQSIAEAGFRLLIRKPVTTEELAMVLPTLPEVAEHIPPTKPPIG